MAAGKTLYVTSREEWRRWLRKHHRSESGLWLIFYKKHSGRPRLPYEHAIEEALCFGWIDSIVKRIDDEKFALKFTPRRDTSNWSTANIRRARKLIGEGRMTRAGLAKVDAAAIGKGRSGHAGRRVDIPAEIEQALASHPKAWNRFRSLTASRQRAYLRLITDAKKPETRQRRVREAITLLERSQGDPDDLPGYLKQAFKAHPQARENFRRLAPSYRRHYVGWITMARQDATRARRIKEAMSLLERNQKLGLK